jgi:hypothetical protein
VPSLEALITLLTRAADTAAFLALNEFAEYPIGT